MKRLRFSVTIQAPRALVWNTVFGAATYRDWTEPFCVGSYYEGSWAAGDRIRFLSPKGSGMSSVIASNRLHEYVSIKHLGFIHDGIEDTESEQVRSWAPAFENYTFADAGAATEIQIEQDITPEYESHMLATWPKALARLKSICEIAAENNGTA